MCERWVGNLTKAPTYWPPSSSIAAPLSHPAELLNWGPEGPALCWVWSSLLRTATTDSKLQTLLHQTGFLSHRVIWFFDIHLLQWASHLHLTQPVNSQGYPLISSTGCTCYLHWYISYLTARSGRRSIFYTSLLLSCFTAYQRSFVILCQNLYIYNL